MVWGDSAEWNGQSNLRISIGALMDFPGARSVVSVISRAVFVVIISWYLRIFNRMFRTTKRVEEGVGVEYAVLSRK